MPATPPMFPNPFNAGIFGTPWKNPVCEVADIHNTAFAMCRQVFREVCQMGQTTSLLISAEAGSGKTHLLSRLRREVMHALPDGRQAVFCWVRFFSSTGIELRRGGRGRSHT